MIPYIVLSWQIDRKPPDPHYHMNLGPQQIRVPETIESKFEILDVDGETVRSFEFTGPCCIASRLASATELEATSKLFAHRSPKEPKPPEPKEEFSDKERQTLMAALDFYHHEMASRAQFQSATAAATLYDKMARDAYKMNRS